MMTTSEKELVEAIAETATSAIKSVRLLFYISMGQLMIIVLLAIKVFK